MNTPKETLACVVSPNAADAELAIALLAQTGVQARAYSGMRELASALDDTIGCLILVEEALLAEDVPALQEALARLPAWCDLPLILVSRDVGALGAAAADAFPDAGNVTLLERPINAHTLISAVQMALRATARQREVGELLAQREQAVRLRDEFLAMLAHELRNPLAPMSNALHIMRMLKIEDPAALKSIQILERQVGHVVRMVDDLMDVARLERGKVVLKKERLDLNRVVSSAVETCLHAAQERGHNVSVRFGVNALPVDGDAVRLEQIVCNLVNNAVKFTTRPDEIVVHTAVEAGFARVAVEDKGIGFHAEAAEHLFDPFLQVNPTLERSAGGLGMGLTIVRRLTELHGGSVHAASEGPGKGSRFVVQIPLASGAAEPHPQAAQPLLERRRRRIVVVEDNPDIRETLRMLLDLWGHEVTMASDGRSGVERVLQERPDVALIDVGLPGMSGYDVARAIRASMPNGEIRLIAVTGYGQPTDRELALQAGFDTHLLKPIAPTVLERLLAQ
ncbi:MAG TPA: ATP-binding protein [Burkholderiales bacterium]|jgi:signal transduction histidine kinase/CheY-like chemotaxis protein|nr:ATP-binding protein [Burkholderiales bacterium]